MKRFFVLFFLSLALSLGVFASEVKVGYRAGSPGLDLGAASVVWDRGDAPLVGKVAEMFTEDVARVLGKSPKLRGDLPSEGQVVIIGTLGHNKWIDQLVAEGRLKASEIRGSQERYILKTIDNPFEGICKALVIAGSDRRGAAYGAFSVSREIGVSPWYWWADVPTRHRDQVFLEADFTSQSPTIKYRGIFINDEDWGLKPWSSNTFEKELGDIGPKTYAKVCELLLRLKGNMLAPAMHSCTGAFYTHPESKVVADEYGIMITTSHCEPLLFNNASKLEWDTKVDGPWNYKTNRKAIVDKLDARVKEAAGFDNVYTLAMRGLHDAGMQGDLTPAERVEVLTDAIADQRNILSKYIKKPLTEIPQIFVPYKEALDVYEDGLQVPDDVTLVWVDDNYGYIKRLSNPEEQKRSGHAGVYYHVSYLGAPHDYLWLCTTPPALMYEELKKAFDAGADRYWLLNVGDIKPAEMAMSTFFEMAWDLPSFDYAKVNNHQVEFLTGIFGERYAERFQKLLADYYRLAWSHKPEFMGWEREWDEPGTGDIRDTEYSFDNYAEAQRRLSEYKDLSQRAEWILRSLHPKYQSAFYELIAYPAMGAYQMNRKFLLAQLNHELYAKGDYAGANWAAEESKDAYAKIAELTAQYNSMLDGKWSGMVDLAPAFCAKFQNMPPLSIKDGVEPRAVCLEPSDEAVSLKDCAVLDLTKYKSLSSDDGHSVSLIGGIGYDWNCIQLGVSTQAPISQARPDGPRAEFEFAGVPSEKLSVKISTLPFFPLYKGRSTRFGVSVDGAPVQVFQNEQKEYSPLWKTQVLRNGAEFEADFIIDPKKESHTLTLYCLDPGVMVQKLILDWGGLQKSYIGPSSLPLKPSAPKDYKIVTDTSKEPIAEGTYEPNMTSLSDYECPEWFRDAKFGIWAHWGPQCQPEGGDWYAREMYIEGNWKNQFQLDVAGHPSEFGFKDWINEWKAEEWDPDSLVHFYKDAGARYFFTLANHHDNLDLYDSSYQEWNTLAVGPKKDIVGGWAEACKKYGLPLGVSVHASHSWCWYETSRGSDKEGLFAGVPYDGYLQKEDGLGKWWEGFDPQELYAQDHPLSPNNRSWDWQESDIVTPDQSYVDKFYNRTIELINKYNPSVVYFDDTYLPLYPISDVGYDIVAHLYNKSIKDNGGHNEAVVLGKVLNEEQKKTIVWDVERGAPDKIQDLPWQTCTCLGDWHYNRRTYFGDKYKSAASVVRMLVDVVSKNGNLLLNVPLKGNGRPDDREVEIVKEIGAWMKVNSESIYGTRPWRVFGEGPSADEDNPISAQGFNEFRLSYNEKDIRFVQKDGVIYATVLGVPADDINITHLGRNFLGSKIKKISLLGSDEALQWTQGTDALTIRKPSESPRTEAVVFKIEMGKGRK